MCFSSYHVHCTYCDGKSSPEEIIKEAIRKKMKYLGFSSHSPLPFDAPWAIDKSDVSNYFKEIDLLKKKYSDQITIFKGMEFDYISSLKDTLMKEYLGYNLDYRLWSVHFVGHGDDIFPVDSKPEKLMKNIDKYMDGDIVAAVRQYYRNMTEMVKFAKPDIIGHFDLIKKNNHRLGLFSESEPWYKKAVMKALRAIKESGAVMEINTGGKARGYTEDFYPSTWIIEEMARMEIPIVMNSDSHHKDTLTDYFAEAFDLVRRCGYKEQHIFTGEGWQKENIESFSACRT